MKKFLLILSLLTFIFPLWAEASDTAKSSIVMDIDSGRVLYEKNANEKRYERCLYFDFNGKTYLLDSISKNLSIIKLDDLDKNLFVFNPLENQYKYYGG